MTRAKREVAAARDRIEKTWDHLVARRERKLQEVDDLERQIRELCPIVTRLSAG
jgi:hypothetical protein